MDLAEATRQYQATLEARRSLIEAVGDSVSFDDEILDATADLASAHGIMVEGWLEHTWTAD